MQLHFDRVSYTHEGAAAPLFSGISLHCAQGWTGVVGANGTGKTTLLRLALGDLSPDEGRIRHPDSVIYCPQRTDEASPDVRAFFEASDAEACRLRGLFGVNGRWLPRWRSLSHGERKRGQIAAALWRSPDALLLDEPTNHIDDSARRLLLAGLRQFAGVGLLVSHDRDLLDALCQQCAWLEPPSLHAWPGTYSEAARARQEEQLAQQRQLEEISSELARLRKEVQRRSGVAGRADRRRSKRGLARGDSDGRERIDRARASGVDGRAGAQVRQMEGRVRHAQARRDAVAVRKSYALGLRLPGVPAQRRRLPGVPAQRRRLLLVSAGILPLANGQMLEHPSLCIGADDRIALLGPNGSGKTTLVRHLLGLLGPDLRDKLVYLPQEVAAGESRDILDRFRRLSREEQGEALTIVSALGSRPPRLLESQQASPGEMRKLLLAVGASRQPHLVVMDEPTNHLDLPAIECLEQALAAFPAALLLVSHDRRFIDAVAPIRWVLTPTDRGSRLEVL